MVSEAALFAERQRRRNDVDRRMTAREPVAFVHLEKGAGGSVDAARPASALAVRPRPISVAATAGRPARRPARAVRVRRSRRRLRPRCRQGSTTASARGPVGRQRAEIELSRETAQGGRGSRLQSSQSVWHGRRAERPAWSTIQLRRAHATAAAGCRKRRDAARHAADPGMQRQSEHRRAFVRRAFARNRVNAAEASSAWARGSTLRSHWHCTSSHSADSGIDQQRGAAVHPATAGRRCTSPACSAMPASRQQPEGVGRGAPVLAQPAEWALAGGFLQCVERFGDMCSPARPAACSACIMRVADMPCATHSQPQSLKCIHQRRQPLAPPSHWPRSPAGRRPARSASMTRKMPTRSPYSRCVQLR